MNCNWCEVKNIKVTAENETYAIGLTYEVRVIKGRIYIPQNVSVKYCPFCGKLLEGTK